MAGRRYQMGESLTKVKADLGIDQVALSGELKRRGISIRYWLTDEEKKNWLNFVKTIEYADWRMSVLRRDCFKCADCGQKRVNMQVHHIFRKSIFPPLGLRDG